MAKKKRIGSSKKESPKKFTFSADNLELTNLIKTLETKKDNVILPQLKSEEKIQETEEDNQEEELLSEPEIPESVVIKEDSKKKEKKVKTGKSSIFDDIGSFVQELLQSYESRYDYWEESTNGILAVLRKMQMVNRENTNVLYDTIDEYHKKVDVGLERFRTKRNFVEQFVDTNFNEISIMLKKTLNLLALQLKEFKIKSQLNQIMLK